MEILKKKRFLLIVLILFLLLTGICVVIIALYRRNSTEAPVNNTINTAGNETVSQLDPVKPLKDDKPEKDDSVIDSEVSQNALTPDNNKPKTKDDKAKELKPKKTDKIDDSNLNNTSKITTVTSVRGSYNSITPPIDDVQLDVSIRETPVDVINKKNKAPAIAVVDSKNKVGAPVNLEQAPTKETKSIDSIPMSVHVVKEETKPRAEDPKIKDSSPVNLVSEICDSIPSSPTNSEFKKTKITAEKAGVTSIDSDASDIQKSNTVIVSDAGTQSTLKIEEPQIGKVEDVIPSFESQVATIKTPAELLIDVIPAEVNKDDVPLSETQVKPKKPEQAHDIIPSIEPVDTPKHPTYNTDAVTVDESKKAEQVKVAIQPVDPQVEPMASESSAEPIINDVLPGEAIAEIKNTGQVKDVIPLVDPQTEDQVVTSKVKPLIDIVPSNTETAVIGKDKDSEHHNVTSEPQDFNENSKDKTENTNTTAVKKSDNDVFIQTPIDTAVQPVKVIDTSTNYQAVQSPITNEALADYPDSTSAANPRNFRVITISDISGTEIFNNHRYFGVLNVFNVFGGKIIKIFFSVPYEAKAAVIKFEEELKRSSNERDFAEILDKHFGLSKINNELGPRTYAGLEYYHSDLVNLTDLNPWIDQIKEFDFLKVFKDFRTSNPEPFKSKNFVIALKGSIENINEYHSGAKYDKNPAFNDAKSAHESFNKKPEVAA